MPGTAKTWLSEHLAAAISGDSTLMVQGTAGTAEEAVRYGWNYARLIAEGPSRGADGARSGDARDGRRPDLGRRCMLHSGALRSEPHVDRKLSAD